MVIVNDPADFSDDSMTAQTGTFFFKRENNTLLTKGHKKNDID